MTKNGEKRQISSFGHISAQTAAGESAADREGQGAELAEGQRRQAEVADADQCAGVGAGDQAGEGTRPRA